MMGCKVRDLRDRAPPAAAVRGVTDGGSKAALFAKAGSKTQFRARSRPRVGWAGTVNARGQPGEP